MSQGLAFDKQKRHNERLLLLMFLEHHSAETDDPNVCTSTQQVFGVPPALSIGCDRRLLTALLQLLVFCYLRPVAFCYLKQ